MEGQPDRILETLLQSASILEHRVAEEDFRYSGLKDLDAILELSALKLRIANHLLSSFNTAHPDARRRANSSRLIREKSTEAIDMLEELRSLNISEDQRELLTRAEGYKRVQEQFQAFILRGGGVFFETQIQDSKKLRLVSRALNDSLRKYIGADDRYVSAFKPEQLPGFLRSLVSFFLPVLAPEGQKDPPYGIEEGEERLLSSERMKMPLSQAIHYLENELLPRLQQELEQNPGSRVIQKQIDAVWNKLTEYGSLTFRTRATPINLEHGFYTDWLTQYSADGELLVTVSIPVKYSSGTNLERMREMVQVELVRSLAGKGISPGLDEDYRYRKSLESGRRGSSRLPSFKIDLKRGFREIRTLYPALRCLENNQEFQKLIDRVREGGRKATQKAIESMLRTDKKDLPRLD